VTGDGTVLVLAEVPRLVQAGSFTAAVLDNLITTVTTAGVKKAEISLYDVLRTNDGLRDLIDNAILRRSRAFQIRGWPTPDDAVPDALAEETLGVLRTGRYHGEPRRASQLLRALPGSPCDILHANTLELLQVHAQWSRRPLTACFAATTVANGMALPVISG
jgi:hypothetical protein